MLNWIVWNQIDCSHKNVFAVKQPTKVEMP